MIEREHARLSLTRQCRLLVLSRSSVYYRPVGESAQTLALMRRIDELYLQYPFYGSRAPASRTRSTGCGATPIHEERPKPTSCNGSTDAQCD